MDRETIIVIVGAIVTGLSLVNEKVRNFILGKATFKKETTEATDDTIEKLMNRVNKLSDEYVRLSELNIQTQKENFTCKAEINKLLNDLQETKINCKDKCFG